MIKHMLQKWLGIKAMAARIVEIDTELHPLMAHEDLNDIIESITGTFPELADDIPIKKGYDRTN